VCFFEGNEWICMNNIEYPILITQWIRVASIAFSMEKRSADVRNFSLEISGRNVGWKIFFLTPNGDGLSPIHGRAFYE